VVCSTSSVCSVCKAVRRPRPLQARLQTPARRCSRGVCLPQLLFITWAAAAGLSLRFGAPGVLRVALLLWLWTCCVFNNAGRLQRAMRASAGASMNCAEAGGDERAHATAAAGLCDRQVRQVHLRPHQRGPGLLLLRHARHLRPPADRRAGAARLRGTPTGCRCRRHTCMLRRCFSRACTAAAPACARRQARLCMPLSSSAVPVSEPGLAVLAV